MCLVQLVGTDMIKKKRLKIPVKITNEIHIARRE